MRRLLRIASCVLLLAAAGCDSVPVVPEYGTSSDAPTKGGVPPADPTQIEGVQSFEDLRSDHTEEPVEYDQTPPVGGKHSPTWADCTGTVYDVQIKNENAVHSLEHGAVWVTYDPELLPEADVATLAQSVSGQDYTMMSPYPGAGAAISLQSWQHQLKVQDVADPRIGQFIDGFRANPTLTPEPGATCSRPEFKSDPVTED